MQFIVALMIIMRFQVGNRWVFGTAHFRVPLFSILSKVVTDVFGTGSMVVQVIIMRFQCVLVSFSFSFVLVFVLLCLVLLVSCWFHVGAAQMVSG